MKRILLSLFLFPSLILGSNKVDSLEEAIQRCDVESVRSLLKSANLSQSDRARLLSLANDVAMQMRASKKCLYLSKEDLLIVETFLNRIESLIKGDKKLEPEAQLVEAETQLIKEQVKDIKETLPGRMALTDANMKLTEAQTELAKEQTKDLEETRPGRMALTDAQTAAIKNQDKRATVEHLMNFVRIYNQELRDQEAHNAAMEHSEIDYLSKLSQEVRVLEKEMS